MTNAAYHQGFRDGKACGCEPELERLRAIVSDLAEIDPLSGAPSNWWSCDIGEDCEGGYGRDLVHHDPGCPWLRATQEEANRA